MKDSCKTQARRKLFYDFRKSACKIGMKQIQNNRKPNQFSTEYNQKQNLSDHHQVQYFSHKHYGLSSDSWYYSLVTTTYSIERSIQRECGV